MKAFRFLCVIFLALGVLSSCDLINPPERIPSYIQIDTVLVSVNDFDQGSASHMMTVCYLSVGGDNIGIFEMPFTVPSLETGLQTIYIRPGVKLNGIAASRIDYPFYEPYVIDYELHEGEIHIIEPTTTYKDECKFPWVEDFEDPGLSFQYADYSDTIFVVQDEILREGKYTGAIFLNEKQGIFEASSITDFVLPQNSSLVLLEFDYKNTNGLEIGMYLLEDGIGEWYDLVYIKPSPVWKRFYVDIGLTAASHPTTDFFRMGFRAFHEKGVADSTEIYLDNIKLIHF
jgi:hypothetical protein